MNSRELVQMTLEGKNSGRAPRQMWLLPWSVEHYKKEVEKISQEFPDDICGFSPVYQKQSVCVKGDPYLEGEYTDEWGCVFFNTQRGLIGEVKQPLVTDDEWNDACKIVIPENQLSFCAEEYNSIRNKNFSEKYVLSAACPRPFEQLQFIRGTENLFMDLMDPPAKMLELMEKMHDFYCRLLTKWAQTDVDALTMMDDWGSQNSLLIDPKLWQKIFMPMYRDYIDIAHKHNKKMFMHSDGYILPILPKLIDIGLDAVNSQLFCMGVKNFKQFKGKITFWGEIDRQMILPFKEVKDVSAAVQEVYETLWDNGYAIAQCEFGAGAKPENVSEVFRKWNELTDK